MLYGIYQSAGGLQVNQYRMEVLANNLANAETAGFKQDLTVVRERRAASRERMAGPDASDRALEGMTGGSLVAPAHTSFEQGPIETTGKPLDVAIHGTGFFRVKTEEGERYTRDGRFMVNRAGELVTVAGFRPVLSETGTPMAIPASAEGPVRIEASGEIKAGKTSYGKLGLVDFEDKSLLRKTGGNLIQALGVAPRTTNAKLEPGAVEKSTVDPTRSMVSMIEVSRAYQLNATMIGLADATLGRAVNDVGRVS